MCGHVSVSGAIRQKNKEARFRRQKLLLALQMILKPKQVKLTCDQISAESEATICEVSNFSFKLMNHILHVVLLHH